MAPLGEAQAPVLDRRVLERIPPADGARRVRVQKRAVLMRRHRATDLRLLAYHHALQDAGVGEAEGARDGGVAGGERDGAEGRGELVQVVADFVDGAVLGLQELAVFRKGICGSWLALLVVEVVFGFGVWVGAVDG